MNKIPVGKTIAYGYGFTFGHLGTIIGLIWLPMVLLAVLSFLPYALGAAQIDPLQNPGEAGRDAFIGLFSSAGTFVLYSMIYVAVTRQALGLRQGGASIHFALGAPEWRMLGAMALLAIVIALLALLYVMAAGIVFGLVSKLGGEMAAALTLAMAALAGACAFLYIVLRFGFLLAPVVVAEEKISLGRAWTLTGGNFWRIFLVTLAIALPILIAQFAATFAIVGPAVFAPLAANADLAAAIQERIGLFEQHMPALLGLTLILAPFALGLNLGAQAFAYRALVPGQGARTLPELT